MWFFVSVQFKGGEKDFTSQIQMLVNSICGCLDP